LNFSQTTAHSGELIAKHVEACLNNWELKRVLSVTMDNATTNDDIFIVDIFKLILSFQK